MRPAAEKVGLRSKSVKILLYYIRKKKDKQPKQKGICTLQNKRAKYGST